MEGASIKYTTNTVEEAKAILEASKHCKKSPHNQIIIQTDSMLLYKKGMGMSIDNCENGDRDSILFTK